MGDARVKRSIFSDFIGPLRKKSPLLGLLPNKKPIIGNPDGTISTVMTMTLDHPKINKGRPSAIPTIFGGEVKTRDEAIKVIIKNKGKDPDTGLAVPSFNTMAEAETFAKNKSARHGKLAQLLGL